MEMDLEVEFIPSQSHQECSETFESSDEDSASPPKKRVRQTLIWEEDKVFQTQEEAKVYVNSLKDFRTWQKLQSTKDTTLVYQCRADKKCPCRVRIRIPNNGT